MKQGWETKKLGDVCIISAGQGAPQGESNYCTNGIPFIKAGNLEGLINGLPESTIQNVSDEVAKKHRLKLYKAGSVVFAKSGMSCMKGYVYALKNDCYVVSHLAILTPHSIDTFFLKYLLEFYRPNTLVKDSAYPSISLEDIKSFSVPVPSLSEQEKIVAELDCLSSIIEKKKQQLKEYDALAQSIFYEMFGNPVDNEKGWKVKKLKNVFSVKIGPFGSLLHNSDYVSGGIPLVNPIHMQNETICPDNDFTVSKEKIEELQNYRLFAGDVIFARRGDIGRCALVRERDNGFLCGTGSLFVRPMQPVDSFFFVKMMRCESMIEHLTSFAKGATMLNINCKIIEDLDIILPPLPLQQSFAQKIEAIEQQKTLIKQSIVEVETLFNSRMDFYFN